MPYDIEKRGSKWVVTGPSGVKGTHTTKAKARKQQKALYANTKEKGKK